MNALRVHHQQPARVAILAAIAGLLVAAFVGPAGTLAATGSRTAIIGLGTGIGLEFSTQPGNGQAGSPLVTQPVVTVIDGVGDTDTSSNVAVTLAIDFNPSGGTLTCTSGLTVAAVAGVATFSGCSVSTAGDGYTLIATASNLTADQSSSFDISLSAPLSSNHLDWAIATVNPPPLSGIAGGPLGFTFNVRVLDSNNNVVTTGQFATAPITLSMTANSANAVVTCTGGNTVNAVAGIATWQGCSVAPPGTGLSFTATTTGITPSTSPTFNILAGGAAPTLTITASKSVIQWGDAVDLTVHMAAPAGSSASVAGQAIQVQVARINAAGAFTTINPGGNIVTDANGNATIAGYTPATNLWYQAVFVGSTSLGPVTSPETRVVVRQLALIKPNNGGATKTISKGTTIEFTAVARPSRDDVPRTHVTWQIWRLVNNHWTLFSTEVSDPDVTGSAFLDIQFNTGSWRLRAEANPTQLNANSVWTPFVTYLVK